MGGIGLTLQTWWQGLEKAHRILYVGGIAVLVLVLVGVVMFASRPNFVVLQSNLSDQEKSGVVDELRTMGIACKYDVPGEVDVPEDKAAEARMGLAKAGKLGTHTHFGLEGLDKMSLMTTPEQQKERIKGMLEGEVATSIETLTGVTSARVHVTLADNSVFSDTKRPATAAIMVIVADGTQMDNAKTGRAIATLTSKAFEGLDLKNVTVINQRSEFLFNGADEDSSQSVPNGRLAMEEDYNRKRSHQIQAALDRVFGPGSTVVTVRAEFDLDSKHEEDTIQKPTEVLLSEKSSEKMQGDTKGRLPGVAGTASNTPDAATPASIDSSALGGVKQGYENKSEKVQRGVDEIHTLTDKVPGTIKSLVINVVGDSKRIKDPNAQSALKSIIDGEIKDHSADQLAFVTNVTMTDFDSSGSLEIEKANAAALNQARINQLMSLLPVVALVLIAAMVIRQAGKFAKAQTLASLDPDTLSLVGGMSSGGSMSGGMVPMSHSGAAGFSSGSTGSSLGILEQLSSQVEEEEQEEPTTIGSIRSKVHVPLEQLKKMANDKPTVVAMLIKSMMLEDRK